MVEGKGRIGVTMELKVVARLVVGENKPLTDPVSSGWWGD